jgi:hypothetical protein
MPSRFSFQGDRGPSVPLPPLRGRQSDLALTERAVRQGWPISDAKRAEIVQECVELALNAPRVRDRLQAIRVLVMMDSLNIRREHNDEESDKEERRLAVERQRALLDSLPPELRKELIERTLIDEPPPPALPGEREEGGGV